MSRTRRPTRIDGAVGRALVEAAERLRVEFAATLDPATVTKVVRACRADLTGSPPGALAELVEDLAREDLADLAGRAGPGPVAGRCLDRYSGGRGVTVIYLLVCGPQPGLGAGWAVEAWHGSRRGQALALAGRGAAPGAGLRVAQAVAVRVLAEQGVAVQGWRAGGASTGRSSWPAWPRPRRSRRDGETASGSVGVTEPRVVPRPASTPDRGPALTR